MKTLKQLLDEKAEKLKAIKTLEDLAAGEKRSLTEEEVTQIDTLLDEAEQLQAEADEVQAGEQRTARLSALRGQNGVQNGNAGEGAGEGRPNNRRRPGRQPEQRTTDGEDPIHPDLSRYSLIRAINRGVHNLPLDGLEAEVSQEIEQRSGRSANGFFMPLALPMMLAAGMFGRSPQAEQRTTLNTTTGAGALVNVTMPTLIEYLRARLVMVKLGAQLIPDLVGTVDIPKETSEGAYSWEAEDADVDEDSITIGQVVLNPLSIGAYTDFTRRFLSQTGFGAEQLARQRLSRSIAIGIDAAAINGDGTNKPTGILQDSNCPTVAIGTNGGPITWAKTVELETTVSAGNADEGSLAYLSSPNGRGQLKTITKDAGSGRFIEELGIVNGYQVASTTLVPIDLTKGTGTDLTALIFGDFSQVLIGMWSAVDILVDPFTRGLKGGARVIAMQDVDVELGQPTALAKIVDMNSV